MPRTEKGVHRGRIDEGTTLTEVQKLLDKYFGQNAPMMSIQGSLQSGPRGSRRTDLDIRAETPTGYTNDQLAAIEKEIQNISGADFYFGM